MALKLPCLRRLKTAHHAGKDPSKGTLPAQALEPYYKILEHTKKYYNMLEALTFC